jgi:hypothetical protein
MANVKNPDAIHNPTLRWWAAERQPWNPVESMPPGVAVWLQVTDAAGERYKLPFPCKLTPTGWLNALNDARLTLVVRPTGWRPYFERDKGKALPGAVENARPVMQQQAQTQTTPGDACSKREKDEGA